MISSDVSVSSIRSTSTAAAHVCCLPAVIMLALTLFESLRSARIELRGLSLQHLRDVRRNAPIMHILMRDGTMYFTLYAARFLRSHHDRC